MSILGSTLSNGHLTPRPWPSVSFPPSCPLPCHTGPQGTQRTPQECSASGPVSPLSPLPPAPLPKAYVLPSLSSCLFLLRSHLLRGPATL